MRHKLAIAPALAAALTLAALTLHTGGSPAGAPAAPPPRHLATSRTTAPAATTTRS